MRRALACCFVLMATLSTGTEGNSQDDDDPDVVVLDGGNRLYGTIIALYRGELAFSIDGAGPVDIDWSNVESLTSPRSLDLELTTGAKLSGALTPAGPGLLGIGSATEALEDVVRITAVEATPAERTSGYADLGLDFLTANDELDVNFTVGIANRTRNYLSEASLDSLVSRLDGSTAQKRNYLQLATRRFLSNRWFAIGHLHFEEDRELDLDARVLFGAGAGRTLLQSNRTILALHGGLAYNRERYRTVPGTDSTAEAYVTLEWDWFELGGDTELSSSTTTFFSFDRSRRRLELDATLRRLITGSMYWSLRLYESYDSDPPPDLEHSDFGITLGLGRSF